MKKIFTLIVMVLCATALFAQSPEKFTYQAVVRNASNALVINAPVGVRVSILQGGVNGTPVYMEMHTSVTNANGLVTLQIGGGNVQQGSFADIDWASGSYFLKTETDPDGGSNYSITSTQQLLSVPYALYAKDAGNGFSGDYNDLTNTPAIPTVPTNVSAFTNDAGYITGYTETDPQFNAWDKDYNDLINKPAIPTVPSNVSAFTNDAGYLTNYTETDPQFNAWDKSYNDLTNKPVLFSGDYNDLINKPTLFDGNYNSLSNRPNLAAVATSGNYNDLINKPSIPTAVGELTNNVGYITLSQVPAQVPADWNATSGAAQILNKPTLFSGNYNDLTNKPTIPTVPANVSAFTNDAGYITSQDIPAIPAVPTNVSAFANDAGYLTGYTETDPQFNAWDKDYNDLTNKPTIPTVPTNVSTFTNDAGYLTSYVETDPNVPAWAKEATKPAYDYSEIANTPVIPTVPTNISAFTNDAGYLTNYTETDPQFNAWDKDYNDLTNKPIIPSVPTNVGAFLNDAGYITSADIPAIPTVPTNVSAFMNDAGYITMDSIPEIPTVPANVSAFANDAGYLTNYTETQALADVIANGNSAGNQQLKNVSDPTESFDAVNLRTLTLMMDSLRAQFQQMQQQIDSLQDLINNLPTVTIPTVVTEPISVITSTTVVYGAEVTSDGGAPITAFGVCWSTSPNPTLDDSYTVNGACACGATGPLTDLIPGTTYYIRAYATNSMGTAYGEEFSFTTLSTYGGLVVDEKSCPEAPTVTDHEGNVYATVQIGNQCWMRDNLRTTTSPSTGTYLIPAAETGYTYTGKQARWFNNDSTTYAPQNYGLLYNWNAAVDTFNTEYGETSVNTDKNNAVLLNTGLRRGICPEGWHLPSDEEWTTMEQSLTTMDVTDSEGWRGDYAVKLVTGEWGFDQNVSGAPTDYSNPDRNASGFSAIAAGYYHVFSSQFLGSYTKFWSSTNVANYIGFAWGRGLFSDEAGVRRGDDYMSYGYSVRCIRGGFDSAMLPTVTTGSVSSITQTTATCSSEITTDGGGTVTARGLCWSTSQNPTISDSHSSDGSGTGTFTSHLMYMMPNTTYYVRAYATNSMGTAYGNQVDFTTMQDAQPCPDMPTVTDHEGNVYNTVQIGPQCWLRENMRATTSPTTGEYLVISDQTALCIHTGKQARWYDNDSSTYAPQNYGLLYNWYAAVDTLCTAYGEVSANTSDSNVVTIYFTGHRRGICPIGWHVPSDADWNQLAEYLYHNVYLSCGYNHSYAKACASPTGWDTTLLYSYPPEQAMCMPFYHPENNNATGFSALPAGEVISPTIAMGHIYHSGFMSIGEMTAFWGATNFEKYARSGELGGGIGEREKSVGYSVRCLRDDSPSGSDSAVTPTDTTIYQSCPGTPTVTDYEGNTYHTVMIGDQCWMKENLRTTKYPDGTDVPLNSGRYYPNNDTNKVAVYGYLYTWNAIMNGAGSSSANPSGVQGICPTGWHIPSDAEWDQMTLYVRSQDNFLCDNNPDNIGKAFAATENWVHTYTPCQVGYLIGNNNTGFSALPAGFKHNNDYLYFGSQAYFWSATDCNFPNNRPCSRGLHSDSSVLFHGDHYPSDGHSVRCLHD
jgi:uncharacterized protein (TIGR02145 family)